MEIIRILDTVILIVLLISTENYIFTFILWSFVIVITDLVFGNAALIKRLVLSVEEFQRRGEDGKKRL